VLVDEKQWIEEGAFLRALNFCTLLPGPEAQQLATYIGWKMHGVRGGLAAGLLFIAPGALVVLALSVLYAYAADLRPVAAAFLGVKAAVLVLVVEALLRLSRRALDAPFKRAVALVAFLALALFQAPFPLVVLAAALVGLAAAHFRPALLKLKPPPAAAAGERASAMLLKAGATTALWLAVWAAPLVLILATLGPHHVLTDVALFFSKLALVTFGGAYAVLAYMAQEAVSAHGWLKPGEMLDGLGLAETTPGPLILVTEFVGFLAAFRRPAPFFPLAAGLAGAAVTLWMTFARCFMWIFVGAPFVERLERASRVQGALAAITAAVVGVIANLALWFGLHVLFTKFDSLRLAGLSFSTPHVASLDVTAAALAVVAAVLLFRLRLGVVKTLGVSVLLSLGIHAAATVI